MINSINIHHPTVIYPHEDVNNKFKYAEYGTISINDRPPIPVPTETLLLLQEELRLVTSENNEK